MEKYDRILGLVACDKRKLKPNTVYEDTFRVSTRLDVFDAAKHIKKLQRRNNYYIVELVNSKKPQKKRVVTIKKIFVLNELHDLNEILNFDPSTKWAKRFLSENKNILKIDKYRLQKHIENGPYEPLEIYSPEIY